MSNYILEGKNLTKHYFTESGQKLIACDNANFTLKMGETLGIVGESGCGKSTLLRMLTQLEMPTSGELLYNGQNITHRKGEELRKNRSHIQMVFQDPASAFSPRMKVFPALCEPIQNFHNLSKKELHDKVADLLTQVGLPVEYMDRYCHAMSGGQRQRLGIARALALDPDILVCDEATSALDVSIQHNIIELLVSIQKRRHLAMVFVCHDVSLVQSLSHKIMVMYLGNVVEVIKGERLGKHSCHPYSRLLMSSLFSLDMDFSKEIMPLEGDVPSPLDVPSGCPFHTRCPSCFGRCRDEKPQLYDVAEEHQVACHLFDMSAL